MKKKCTMITFLGILGMVSEPAIAEQYSSPSILSQRRIGFGLAGEYMNIDSHLNVNVSTTGNVQQKFEQSQTAKKLQIAPCIELGTSIANTYYLALHFSWRYSGAKNTSSSPGLFTNVSYLQKFSMNQYTDLLIKMGYMFAPRTMIYGLVGPSIANWTHTTSVINKSQTLLSQFKTNKTTVGVGLGIGLEHFIQKKYAVGIDFTHYFHRTISNSQKLSVTAPPLTRSGDFIRRIRPSYSTIAIRFTTYFQL